MKNCLTIFFTVLLFSSLSFAQFDQYPRENRGQIAGGFGPTWIDDEPYYSLRFFPELSLANFGVGLDLRLDIDKNGNLRKENFNEFSDYLSLIRYVRYGQKNDPVFVKLGALDYYTLGHGSIMYLYNNSPSFDARKIGLVLDVDFGNFGFESIYSRFAEAGVAGFRGYVRPLQFTELGIIPIIGSFEIGATFASDFHKYAGIISALYDPAAKTLNITDDKGAINIIGFDLGFPIISNSMLDLTLYLDYAKILDFGNGAASGLMANLRGLGIVTASAKLERRFNGKQYIPSYFNSLYEIERFETNASSQSLTSPVTKAQRLAFMPAENGYYGELFVSVLGTFNIFGGYQRLDKISNSGILHLNGEVAPEELPFLLRAGYDKLYIKNEKDLFTLDDRSYLFVETGYRPYPFMVIAINYNWTYTPVRDADKNIIDYKPQKRIEPRVYFMVPFDMGGEQ
ncbi:MAG TPA: hypothetical protein VMT35_16655 [Ignavibacteriaceae bacterium]|nr:hypothetical protein [Ignavibacteriaceae bacterium]